MIHEFIVCWQIAGQVGTFKQIIPEKIVCWKENCQGHNLSTLTNFKRKIIYKTDQIVQQNIQIYMYDKQERTKHPPPPPHLIKNQFTHKIILQDSTKLS